MRDVELEERLGAAVTTDPATMAKAGEVLATAQVGYLAMTDEDGPYVVPVSFAYDGEKIHFHGGEGKKAAALAREPRVCLAATTTPRAVKGDKPCAYNFEYRSVLAFGRVRLLDKEGERDAALRAIIAKYHPESVTDPLDPEVFSRTTVYTMEIRALTYKQNPGS